jgi:hypothetical protein
MERIELAGGLQGTTFRKEPAMTALTRFVLWGEPRLGSTTAPRRRARASRGAAAAGPSTATAT